MAIEQLQDILMSCGNKARWPELENRVKQLVVEQQTTGRGVSTVPIRQKAKAIAEEMDIEHFQGDNQASHITNIPLTHKVEKKGPARWRYAQRGTKSRRSPWFSAATETDRALDDGRRTLLHKDYEAAVGKLCHHMRVDCRHMDYDTVFMYWKSFPKINAEAELVALEICDKGLVKTAHQRLFFLRTLKKHHLSSDILVNFYRCSIESILTSCVTVWYGNCSASHWKALQKVVKTAQRIAGASLPSIEDIYRRRCHRRAKKISKDSCHPAHGLSTLMPSGRRYRSLWTKTTRFRNSFFPTAVSLLNSDPSHFTSLQAQ
ncbi:hypothetical protein D4764_03G0002710 [Takifugu flavidus]|uniref:Alkylated DNA repair protein AlkB homologue 8 N-terminal domain-containing protein n=1 Tax=Takifugu flavidus TaxID=433684 RepID=A0A5C6N7Z1_9TELE|nr:hypothetical protein D4764_03G0002710 [Takifugu flavidus]